MKLSKKVKKNYFDNNFNLERNDTPNEYYQINNGSQNLVRPKTQMPIPIKPSKKKLKPIMSNKKMELKGKKFKFPTRKIKYSNVVKLGTQYSKKLKQNLTEYLWVEHWLKDNKLEKYILFFHENKLYDTHQLYNRFKNIGEFEIFLKKNKIINKQERVKLIDEYKKIKFNTKFFKAYEKKIEQQMKEKISNITLNEWYDQINMPYLKNKKLFPKEINTILDLVLYIYSLDDFNNMVKRLLSPKEIKKLTIEYKKLVEIKDMLMKDKSIIKDEWSEEDKNEWVEKNFYYFFGARSHENVNKLKKLTKKELQFLTFEKIEEIFPDLSLFIQTIIYNYLFPTKGIHILHNLYKQIENINSVKSDDYKNYRVFFLGSHGISCSLTNMKWDASERLYFNHLDKDINKDNIVIYTTQSFGRLSSSGLRNYFIKNNIINGAHHINKDTLFKALYNTKSFNELKIIDDYITLSNYFIANKNKTKQNSGKAVDYFSHQYQMYKDSGFLKKYLERPETKTTQRLVNLMKYHVNNPPPNVKYSYDAGYSIDVLGILELTNNNIMDLNNLYDDITRTKKIDMKTKMGLNIKNNSQHKTRYQNLDKVLKYNQALYEFYKLRQERNENIKYYTLKDVIKIIYKVGNIKKGEKVLIISNHCRGISNTGFSLKLNQPWDMIELLEGKHKKTAEAIRELSREKMATRL